eukprot:9279713-Lingulodinium_polyedra.AAC.1
MQVITGSTPLLAQFPARIWLKLECCPGDTSNQQNPNHAWAVPSPWPCSSMLFAPACIGPPVFPPQ